MNREGNVPLGQRESGSTVGVVHLLDRVGVGGRAQVQSEIILVRSANDRMPGTVHGVLEARVDDVLFARAGDTSLKGARRLHGDFLAKSTLNGFLYRA